jgi:hypothetical protein
MRNIWIVLLACLIVTAALRAESAEEMASNCKDIPSAAIADGKIAIPQDFNSGVCWGAFASLQAAIRFPFYDICAPENSTRSQLIQVFLAYMRQHPEKLNEDFFLAIYGATRQAFPCRK